MQAGGDRELIEASRRGDRAAFATIIERHQRAVYAVAFAGTRDRALADDVTQDAFVIAWRRLGELRDLERLPAWLCGIARNLARDTRKRVRHDVVDPERAIDSTTPYDALSEAETERIVQAALGQVPDVYREPLVLFYYEERSVEDVARYLGITAATTNKRLSRGRQYLRERVEVVERGVARRGAPAALATAVLAAIAITVPAAHVDASPVAKGSTMHKLAIAACAAAAIAGGGAVIVATTTHSGAAHASAQQTDSNEPSTKTSPHAALGCGHHAAAHAAARPSLPELFAAHKQRTAVAFAANDCGTVGQHLADLEGATGEAPGDPVRCATDYAGVCSTESWSLERRLCVLAADDVLNAHLCAFETTPPPTASDIPPALACGAIASHIAPIAQGAGLYADVPDFAAQIESACDNGAWSVALRQCFINAQAVEDLHACIKPS
jgi:RNA polymerase sigma factor (sigma-70 family)